MALTSAQQITQLYIGYFDRAPDPEGLNYWIGRLNSGEMNVQQIAESFSEQPETLATYPFLRYPNLLENDAKSFITEIYQNAFNRAPDAAGLTYWTNQLISGAVPVGDFIASVLSGATNSAAGQDLSTLNNKTTVGLSYATQVADANVQWTIESAHAALQGVTDAQATVVAAEARIEAFVDAAGSVGETIVLEAGNPGPYVGGALNDTFQGILSDGNNSTFQTFDKIDGKGGVNTLQLIVERAPVLPNATTISNVQVVKLDQTNGLIQSPLSTSAFGDSVEALWQIGASSEVTLSKNGQTAGFENTAPANVVTDKGVADATVALNQANAGAYVSVGTASTDLKTVSINGSIEHAANVDAVLALDLGAKVTNLNLSLDQKTDVSVINAEAIKVIDAAASAGGIDLDLSAAPTLALETATFGKGADSFTAIADSFTSKSLSISTADGNDLVDLSGVFAKTTSLTIDLGAGNDVATLDGSFTLDATVSVNLGAGNDTINVSGLTATSAVSLTGGAGSDLFAFANLTNYDDDLGGKITITDFNGGFGGDVLNISALGNYGRLNNNQIAQVAEAKDLDAAIDAALGFISAGDVTAFNYGGSAYILSEGAAGAEAFIEVAGVSISSFNGTNFIA